MPGIVAGCPQLPPRQGQPFRAPNRAKEGDPQVEPWRARSEAMFGNRIPCTMKPPRIEGLCPLIQVFDMPTSLAFYRDLLGFEVVQQAPPGDRCDWAWLTRDGADLMLNTMFEADARPPAPDRARVVAHGDTGLFIGAPDVDAMYEYLRACEVQVEPPVVRPYGMKQLCLRDPDGYGICFQCRVAEPGAAPNSGPATPLGTTGATEGPPAVR